MANPYQEERGLGDTLTTAAKGVGYGLLGVAVVAGKVIEAVISPNETLKRNFESDHIKLYDVDARLKLEEHYRQELGVGAGGIFDEKSKAAFLVYDKNRAKDALVVFGSINYPDDKTTINEKLQGGTDEAVAARKAIEDILKPDTLLNDAIKKYTKDVMLFEEKCKQIPKMQASVLLDLMLETQSNALKAINDKQDAEVKALTQQLDMPDDPENFSLMQNLRACLEAQNPTEAQTKKLKEDMLNALKESHETKRKEFEETTKQAIDNLTEAIKKQTRERATIQMWGKNSPEMMAELERIAKDKKPGTVNLIARTGSGADQYDISGVGIKDLKKIISISGGEPIEVNKGDPDNPVYTLKFSRRIQNPFYEFSYRENIMTDMMLMAQAVQLNGFSSINMTMNFPDEEDRLERGRIAYAACIKTGFPPDKIKILGPDKTELTEEMLFKTSKEKALLGELKKESAEVEAKLAKGSVAPDYKKDTSELRKKLQQASAAITDVDYESVARPHR